MRLFVRLPEVAEMLCCSESAALKALERFGVKPYIHGSGRGAGKTWYLPAIQQLAADMHDAAQDADDSKSRTKKPSLYDGHVISGKSKSEIKLLLAQNTAMQ